MSIDRWMKKDMVCVRIYMYTYIGTYIHMHVYIYTIHTCMLSRFSHVQLFVTLWTRACLAPPSTGFSRQQDWSGCSALPQGSFLTQGLIPGLFYFLPWQVVSLPLAPSRNPHYTHTHTHTHTCVHIHNGILLSHKKEQNNAICSNTDETRDYHTK